MNDSQITQLANIVGKENLTVDTASLRGFGWEGALPRAFVAPSTPEEVCEIVRVANAEQWKLAPVGSMTKLRMGGIPHEIDIVLSLGRLRRVVDYQPADLTISVEAGMTIEEAERHLEANGQILPLDVPFGSRATVGGVIATNASGPRRLGYGSLRDMVIGIQFVTADGRLAKSGGKVVKNVAGYDVAKLLIGSYGTLAIVTGATFKLFPKPTASTTVVCGFDSVENALQARDKLLNSAFSPQALDIVDAAAGNMIVQPALSHSPFSLIVHAAGPKAAIERIQRETLSIVREDGIVFHNVLMGEKERQLWRAIYQATPSAILRSPEMVVVKASLQLSKMREFLDQSTHTATAGGLQFATVARAGTGIVYCYLWPATTNKNHVVGSIEDSCRSVQAEATRLGGSTVIEWCPESLKDKIELWATPGDDFPLMQRLKSQMDPTCILNPGTLWGYL